MIMSKDIKSTLKERGDIYGPFKDGAATMQALKKVIRANYGYADLNPAQCEALDMILHKVGRIVNGNPNYIDNWRDISGFSSLIVEILQKDESAIDSKVEYFSPAGQY